MTRCVPISATLVGPFGSLVIRLSAANCAPRPRKGRELAGQQRWVRPAAPAALGWGGGAAAAAGVCEAPLHLRRFSKRAPTPKPQAAPGKPHGHRLFFECFVRRLVL